MHSCKCLERLVTVCLLPPPLFTTRTQGLSGFCSQFDRSNFAHLLNKCFLVVSKYCWWRSHLVDGGLVQLHQALHHLPAHHGEEAEEQDHACYHVVHSKRRFFKESSRSFPPLLKTSSCFYCLTQTYWPTGCPVHLISGHTLHCVQRTSHLICMHTMCTQLVHNVNQSKLDCLLLLLSYL